MRPIFEQNAARIAQLEADNAKLREAMERLRKTHRMSERSTAYFKSWGWRTVFNPSSYGCGR